MSKNSAPPCPVLQLAHAVATESRQLNADLHRLNRAVKQCEQCEQPCGAINDFYEATDAALREISHLWGL